MERARMKRRLLTATAIMLLVAGCSKEPGKPGNAQLGPAGGAVAGLKWQVPKSWTTAPERPMRVATYGVPAGGGDNEPAECVVSFFGSGQGGATDANIDRWVGQFENPDLPSKTEKEVNGIKVTLVQIAGTYLAPAGPMMQATGKKENFRLLGAIVEGPEGTVFFKLTGPARTVGSAQPDFDAMIGSLSR
jgi:hypothetical protein